MFWDRSNNGDVIFGIGRIQKGIETTSPGRDFWGHELRKQTSSEKGEKTQKKKKKNQTNNKTRLDTQIENIDS